MFFFTCLSVISSSYMSIQFTCQFAVTRIQFKTLLKTHLFSSMSLHEFYMSSVMNSFFGLVPPVRGHHTPFCYTLHVDVEQKAFSCWNSLPGAYFPLSYDVSVSKGISTPTAPLSLFTFFFYCKPRPWVAFSLIQAKYTYMYKQMSLKKHYQSLFFCCTLKQGCSIMGYSK